MRYVIILVSSLFIVGELTATCYYLDPVNGDIANAGTINSPWGSFSEVIGANLISSKEYANLPYDGSNNLVLKNINGPIQAGDTLYLLDGLHGEVFLQNYINDLPITVMGLEGHQPIIAKVHLQACKNWIFENVEVSSEAYGYYLNNRLFYVESHGWQGPSSHIAIRNCKIYSSAEPWELADEWINQASGGVYVRGDSCQIIDNQIYNVDMGLTCFGDYILAEGNQIVNFSGDGGRILGSHISFNYNLIKNCYDVDENHDDGIQSFTTNGAVVDSNQVIGNVIINTDDDTRPLNGPLQGIGCFDGFYNDWLIANNVIYVNHWHGLSLYGARRCTIIHNTVIDPSPTVTPGRSWIRINEHKDGRPSTDCVVANNVSNKLVVQGFTTHNMLLDSISEYDDHFMDISEYDFRLVNQSELINVGTTEHTIPYDIDLNQRDDQPDIGAYEFQTILSTGKETLDRSFEIFPNPVIDRFSMKNIPAQSQLFLYDMHTNLIRKGSLTFINQGLSLLPSGCYLLKILFPDDQETIVKFLKL